MKLDKDQETIINSEEKNIVVVAGAGSGKTTVLTQRIKHLIIDKGVRPEDIIAITFTNAAADEMRERLSEIKNIDTMFIGTIHSFANTLLQISCPDVNYQVLSDEKFVKAADIVLKKYCKYLKLETLLGFLEIKEKARNGKADYSEVETFLTFEESYEYEMMMRTDIEKMPNSQYPESIYSWCEDRNILTFDNLIVYAKRNLGEDFAFPYLFVDEYQDVGTLEDGFIRSLEAEHTFIVGDDWQSIYGFKGANVSIFKSYVQSPEWTTYYLDRNYRSAKNIIKLAETVIADDAERLDKHVVPMSSKEGVVCFDVENQLIKHLKTIKRNKEYRNWFLLARTRKDINAISDYCKMVGLPAMFFSREGLTKEQEQELLEKNAVKIATIHGVKGLEAENVLMYGNFPVHGQMSYSCQRNHAKRLRWYEERRIMYVGVTRAKNRIIILSNKNDISNNVIVSDMRRYN